MNSRRSFLQSILKAGVAAMVLPAATTYARSVWKKSPIDTLYTIKWGEEIALANNFIYFLPSFQDFCEAHEKLNGPIKWEIDKASTMRGVRVTPSPIPHLF